MSFLDTNKHFINQFLLGKMKNLTYDEKYELYFKSKVGKEYLFEETRARFTSYYKSINQTDNTNLYFEVFELIGEFDSEFILLNLFLEKNVINILNYLFDNKIKINNEKNNNNLTNLLSSFKKIHSANKIISNDTYINTLFQELNEKINYCSSKSLTISQSNLRTHYLSWLFENIKFEKQYKTFIYFIIIYKFLYDDSDYKNRILVLHEFIQKSYLNFSIDIKIFYSTYLKLFQESFINEYIPVINEKVDNNSPAGYIKWVKEFDMIFQLLAEIDKPLYLFDFQNIFKIIHSIGNIKVSISINSIISNLLVLNIENLNLIVNKLLQVIHIDEAVDLYNRIIRKFYLYVYFEMFEKNTNYIDNDYLSENEHSIHSSSIRLMQAALEFNVSVNRLLDYLSKCGVDIKEMNANTKLSSLLYYIIEKEFGKNKSLNKAIIKTESFHIMTEKKNIHSDNDLNLFQKNIINYISERRNQIIKLYQKKKNLSKIEKDKIDQKIFEHKKRIKKCEKLLLLIENKTYGICNITGELINTKDLLENPFKLTKY